MIMPQEIIAAKSEHLHQIVDELLTIVSDAVQHQTPVHKVEEQAFETLLRAGLATIQLLVECLGNGDAGEVYELPDGRTVKRSPQPQARPYVSIFGLIVLERFVYAKREGQKIEFTEADARLALPEGKFFYLLQDWDQSFVMEQPFGKVSKAIEKILGLRQHVDSLEHMNRACHFRPLFVVFPGIGGHQEVQNNRGLPRDFLPLKRGILSSYRQFRALRCP